MPGETEHEIQRGIVAALEGAGVLVFAIPNGGARHPAVALRMRAEGVRPGVPDLFVPALRLFLEVKTETGRLSGAQARWRDVLQYSGYSWVLVRSVGDAMDAVKAAQRRG